MALEILVPIIPQRWTLLFISPSTFHLRVPHAHRVIIASLKNREGELKIEGYNSTRQW